jgi:starch synthase
MDSAKYFKRKGIYEDRDGKLFPDNLKRAVLFARSVLTTATNLGWSPDVVHAHGWISALVPVLLKTEFAESDLFSGAKCFYSDDGFTLDDSFSAEQLEKLGLPADDRLVGKPLSEVGPAFADMLVTGEGAPELEGESVEISGTPEEMTEKSVDLYGRFAGVTVEA